MGQSNQSVSRAKYRSTHPNTKRVKCGGLSLRQGFRAGTVSYAGITAEDLRPEAKAWFINHRDVDWKAMAKRNPVAG